MNCDPFLGPHPPVFCSPEAFEEEVAERRAMGPESPEGPKTLLSALEGISFEPHDPELKPV